MGPEYRIRRAQAADWRCLRSIRLRSLADTPDAFGSTLAEEQRLSEDAWRRRGESRGVAQFLAATPDHGEIGIAVGAAYAGLEATAGLFAMWIAPEARRHGVGAALVRAVVDWARSESYRRVILNVGEANAPAIRLYESCGFVATGKTRLLPPPRQHIAEAQMEKRLR